MVKILVFDTETTDKGPLYSATELTYSQKQTISNALINKDIDIANKYWNEWIDKWSYITQLSYIVYDTDNPKKTKIVNHYIKLNKEVEISIEASAITHIYKSTEDALNKHVDPNANNICILDNIQTIHIVDVLNEFIIDFQQCAYIVAHNIDFDKKMILAELKRHNKIEDMVLILNSPKYICTMMKTINLCKLPKPSINGNIYYKYPTLLEAYKTLFRETIKLDNLHNALYDVVICLRIFCKLGEPFDIDINNTNKDITLLLNTVSPRRSKRLNKLHTISN
jgi:DNA polymerase III epsilon subunit-like protein